MHAINTVCEGLEDLANFQINTTDQHIDASDSRVKNDSKDIENLLQWFPKGNKILSIANGVVGDDKISCHRAREIEIAVMSKMTGMTFNNIKLKLIK